MSEINKYQVRIMRKEDIEQVAEIERGSFPIPWTIDIFFSEMNANKFANYIVIAEEEIPEKVLAYGGFWLIFDEAHITNIAVSEEYRGKKLGELLMQNLMETAYRAGALRMTLEVRKSNTRAQTLYLKYGFKIEGVRKKYYSDNGEDAFIMWADLQKVIRG